MYHFQYYLLFQSIFIGLYNIKSDFDITAIVNAIVTTIGGHYYLFKNFDILKHFVIKENADKDPGNENLILLSIFMVAYGIVHIYDSIKSKRVDYIVHSIILLVVNLVPYYHNIVSNLAPFMTIETSSIFLCFINRGVIFKKLFFVTFVLYRLIFFPMYTVIFIRNNWENISPVHRFIRWLSISLNILNYVWGIKIIHIASRTFRKIKKD